MNGKLAPSRAGYLLNLALLQAIEAGKVDEVTRLSTQKDRLFQQAVETQLERGPPGGGFRAA
jgi:hypothetical protein